LPTSTNPITNFWLLQNHFTVWTQISFFALFILTLTLLIIKWKKFNHSTKILISSSIIGFILLVFIARSQIAIHYFFPFIIATQVSLVFLLNKLAPKYSILIIFTFIIISFFKFPTSYYQPAVKTINEYRNFTTKMINYGLFNNLNSQYNIFCARETPTAVLGWEYRYFLSLNKFNPLPPDQYNSANNLLVIQEANNHDNIDTLKSWELDQFGPKKLIHTTNIDGRKIFLFSKK
jgi:hypothetical protein